MVQNRPKCVVKMIPEVISSRSCPVRNIWRFWCKDKALGVFCTCFRDYSRAEGTAAHFCRWWFWWFPWNPLKSHWYSLYNKVRMYSIIWWKLTVFGWFFGCDLGTYPLNSNLRKYIPDLAFSDIVLKHIQRRASNSKKQKSYITLYTRSQFWVTFWWILGD